MVYTDGIHLIATDRTELHDFAWSIGLRRCWFENHRHPHYDLYTDPVKRAEALALALEKGAILTTSRELVKISNGTKVHHT